MKIIEQYPTIRLRAECSLCHAVFTFDFGDLIKELSWSKNIAVGCPVCQEVIYLPRDRNKLEFTLD